MPKSKAITLHEGLTVGFFPNFKCAGKGLLVIQEAYDYDDAGTYLPPTSIKITGDHINELRQFLNDILLT